MRSILLLIGLSAALSAGRAAEPLPLAPAPSAPAPLPVARTAQEQTLLRYYAAVNEGNPAAAVTELAAEFHSDAAFPGGKKNDRAGFQDFLTLLRTAFPDAKIEVIEFISEGDTTICRYRFTGTHRAKFLNLRPTRKTATVTGVDIWRFQAGHLVALQGYFDSLGLLVQLGLVPEVK